MPVNSNTEIVGGAIVLCDAGGDVLQPSVKQAHTSATRVTSGIVEPRRTGGIAPVGQESMPEDGCRKKVTVQSATMKKKLGMRGQVPTSRNSFP